MRKLVLAVTCALAACGGSPEKAPFSPPGPVPLAVRGNVGVVQRIPLAGGEYGGFGPGAANVWDLDAGFRLADGYDGQFAGALELSVGALTATPPTYESVYANRGSLASFPYDQLYDELTFYGPVARAADGAVTAVVAAADPDSDYLAPLAGTYGAYLMPTSDSRLSRSVALPATTGGETLTLSWIDDVVTSAGHLGASSTDVSYQPYFRVAVRGGDGALLEWALPAVRSESAATHAFDLTGHAGQTVTISFEYRSNAESRDFAMVDDVSITSSDAPSENLLANGDFEAGTLAGWTASDAGEPTGIASGARTLAGLEVERLFYAVPGNAWARWADVFTNRGGTAVSTDVVLYTLFGSGTCGVISVTPGTGGKAVTEWDATAGSRALPAGRDVGLAYGHEWPLYISSTDVVDCDGLGDLYLVAPLTVPAGGTAVLVHFVVMGGANTGLTATDVSARATEVDAQLAAIVSGVWSDPQYLAGLTGAQIAAIANW